MVQPQGQRRGTEEKETRRESLQRVKERRKVCLEGWMAGIRRAFRTVEERETEEL